MSKFDHMIRVNIRSVLTVSSKPHANEFMNVGDNYETLTKHKDDHDTQKYSSLFSIVRTYVC